MKQYLDLVNTVLENGTVKNNRTGTDTIMYFGYHYKVDLAKGFPLLTTKKVFFNSEIRELLWYLNGETHIRNLREHTKIWDAWTSKEKKWEFVNSITMHTMLNEQISNFYRGFKDNAHPMAILCGVVGAMAAFYHDSTDINNADEIKIASYRLIAKMPTIAAMAYKFSIGQPIIYPKNSLIYSENYLNMVFSVPAEKYEINPIFADALDKILILHADHEQNASTSTVRLAGSSGANPFACIAAGIASLWGPAHGGANEAVIKMLNEIESIENIKKFIDKAKDRNDSFRLMGFGHRVYKNYDPRARVLQKIAERVLKEKHLLDNKLFDLAKELEYLALNDDYFKEKKLYPNVDFYSGIILRAIGFPVSLFTVIFAVARTVGWISHWNEMISDQNSKIGRPRQLYTGKLQREFS